MQQSLDFLAETEALHAVVAPLDDSEMTRPTQFKDWTITHVLQHLHYFNLMAFLSLTDPERFLADYAVFADGRAKDGSMVGITDRLLQGLRGASLREAWIDEARRITPIFSTADPKARVKWAGPDMSVRSSITARLMETRAHGQAIYDILGIERRDHDRIRNIAHMGVSTYGWTFLNRGEDPPEPMPFIRLTGPSGTIWEWGENSNVERVEGPASAFCQVVTQVRNIADVELSMTGPNSARWMTMAQCFAGPPHDPPAPGTRFRVT
jgi:uncharacterized protein (TIGR03084 family)